MRIFLMDVVGWAAVGLLTIGRDAVGLAINGLDAVGLMKFGR